MQRHRLPWLGRLARLADRYRVLITTGVFGAEYQELLGKAKIVFNRSVRGECNLRCFEAAAAGALLLVEEGNAATAALFRPGQECVTYHEANLEQVIAQYLGDETERARITAAARQRVEELTFERLWGQEVAAMAAALPTLRQQVAARGVATGEEGLRARLWQAGGPADLDPPLVEDLTLALGMQPDSADLSLALGVAAGRPPLDGGYSSEAFAAALGHFERAVAADPGHVLAWLHLAQARRGLGREREAVAALQQALLALERTRALSPAQRQGCPFPLRFDHFRVEWERCAWEHAGDPGGEDRAKKRLLRWQMHTLLAELTGDLVHFHQAVLARPDLPPSQARLGCALARAGRLAEARPHVRLAAEANPFDPQAARALYQLSRDLGDDEDAESLLQHRRLLARAAPRLVPVEDWFAEPPAAEELASLVILCCNQAAFTQLCLESVLRCTRAPYELILVDNGSTDQTPALLEQVKGRAGPERVLVLRNEHNVGFPRGCNQAARPAQGRYLVFLNNDTVVTPGWLEGLIRPVVTQWPQVGLVGAVTNASRAPQQIEVSYRTLEEIAPFAARRRQEFAGKTQQVRRLTGFCLLARREVFARVGGFDERYGLGFFDDDDLSVSVLRAGYQLVVAEDVFVHHFGSKTFAKLGVDARRLLRANLALFQEKWGEAEAAGYRLPAPTAVVPPGPRMTVSLCLIVKNEEANLPDCLRAVLDLVDEVILVDTGSTDRTREIAAGFGTKVKVFDFPWPDSFAAARNESLRHASGAWIFWMDADDRLDETNRAKLRTLFAALPDENVAYVMKCFCVPDAHSRDGTLVDHVRLFRHHPLIRWEHRVHEQILGAVRRSGGQVRWSDVVVTHVGYVDPALRQKKLQRDLRLLELEYQELGEHPFTLFNLGQVSQELGRHQEALDKGLRRG